MKHLCLVLALLTAAGCATGPPPVSNITHEKPTEEAFAAVATVFMDNGYAITQSDEKLGVINTDWLGWTGLFGNINIRYIARISDGSVRLQKQFNVGTGSTGEKTINDSDPVLRRIKEILGGEYVFVKP